MCRLHRPFTRGEWPDHLGGPGFPETRGKYSKAWQDLLLESGSPIWPDPDDPACHSEPDLPAPIQERKLSSSLSHHSGSDWSKSDAVIAHQKALFEDNALIEAQKLVPELGEKSQHPSHQHRLISDKLGLPSAAELALTRTLGIQNGLARQIRQNGSRYWWESVGGGVSRRWLSEEPAARKCPGRGKEEKAAFMPAWFSATWSYMDKKKHFWNHNMTPPTQVRVGVSVLEDCPAMGSDCLCSEAATPINCILVRF